ncbi:S1 family peptidase [Nonomuraea guangzhouensis]|uniref:S1 family peptidase n=1 Tax=Nonomuraea guangzhouensis TaxID=1291555 RepID=A0ABW4G920_9ACTN|nr:S1 family peptidase [Nonomuraea guangzhouensis]
MVLYRPSAAGAALAIIALVLTAAPATAAPFAVPVEAAPAATVAPPQDVLDAMRRDLGLTREQAITRLGNEEQARRLQPRLRAQLKDRYAGSWVNQEGRLVVATTDAASATAVTAAGAQAKVVGRSLAALTSVKNALDTTAQKAAGQKVPVWFVDEQANAVVVQALDAAAGAAFVAASGVDRAAVRIETIAERPVTFQNLRGGDAYYIAGGSRCSIGFPVTQGSTQGFVTAGHCGTPGLTTTGPGGQGQGTFQGSSFPGNDYSWVAVNSTWVARPAVNAYGTEQVPVFGSAEAPAGSAVCRSGSTTHWHCGVIQERNASVTYSQGTVYEVVRTNVCAEPGDSGGPFISGYQAQGVTSGGSGNCSAGGTTFFQPVNEILNAYGLTLSTVTTQCAGHPNHHFNDLTAHQGSFGMLIPDPGLYPPNGFTSAGAGTHTACMDGPGTARMRLSLEKYTCCGPFGIPIWAEVATTRTGTTAKTLTTSQAAGTYRWVVSVSDTYVVPTTPIGEYYFLGTTSPA